MYSFVIPAFNEEKNVGLIYDIIGECKGILKIGDNELIIKGYGSPQKRIFKIKKD